MGILASRATCLAILALSALLRVCRLGRLLMPVVAIQDILFSSSTGVGIPATLIVRTDLVLYMRDGWG